MLNNRKNIGKDSFNVVKKYLPQNMASGTIGALIGGALTSSGLGFLYGLAIDAGFHIIKNFDNKTKSLFGSEYVDEDGNKKMSGGIFSKIIYFHQKENSQSFFVWNNRKYFICYWKLLLNYLVDLLLVLVMVFVHYQTVKNLIE